jgi:hypothetical protein
MARPCVAAWWSGAIGRDEPISLGRVLGLGGGMVTARNPERFAPPGTRAR